MKKDSIHVLNLLVTKKQCDVYYVCVQLLESVDNELKELKIKLEQERITPLDDKIEEMENKQCSLEKSYFNHPSLPYHFWDKKRDTFEWVYFDEYRQTCYKIQTSL